MTDMSAVVVRKARARLVAATSHRGEIGAALGRLLNADDERILWRIEAKRNVTIEWDSESEFDEQIRSSLRDIAVEAWEFDLRAGTKLLFSIDAIPTICRKLGRFERGKRTQLSNPEDKLNWLKSRLGKGGVVTIDSHISMQDGDTHFSRYAGRVTVVDPLEIGEILLHGLGPSKSRGFGLLLCKSDSITGAP